MRIPFFERELSVAKGSGPAGPVTEPGVPTLHHPWCRLILHEPEAGYQRSGPGPEKTAREADDLITRKYPVTRGLASAQGDECAAKIQAQNVGRRQPAIV